MDSKQDLPILTFISQADWEAWLDAHHAAAKGLWLKIAKKDADVVSVGYGEALESALCYGWIDGQKATYDERFWLQRFTPRGRRSKWSRVNREKAEQLETQGRLRPAGRAQVEAAREDGRWDAAYESQSRAAIPDDLQRALDAHPGARAFFETLDSANRYAILYRLQDAKRPETRARRLAQYVAMLDENKTLHP
ncbi:MAG TPA: YdeI/OmpD-associated family protein [Chloroflexota bacterium]|jgi:uncharacterized protein YdeI (YjbR/CyaY-like superfamily)